MHVGLGRDTVRLGREVIVAHSVAWGFMVATPPAKASEHGKYELVHVPGLTSNFQLCRVRIEGQDVWVLFLVAEPHVEALLSRFPGTALALIVEDALDRSRVIARGASAVTAAAAVAIAKYNGTLTDETRWWVEVGSVVHDVDVGFEDGVWAATVRCQTGVV